MRTCAADAQIAAEGCHFRYKLYPSAWRPIKVKEVSTGASPTAAVVESLLLVKYDELAPRLGDKRA